MTYYFNIIINDKIESEDCQKVYELPLEAYLIANNLGHISGGSVTVDDEGEIQVVDIELCFTDIPSSSMLQDLATFLEKLGAPKGSSIAVIDADEDDLDYAQYVKNTQHIQPLSLGKHEGIAIYLDANLDEDVYAKYDTNELIADFEIALGIDEAGENDALPLRCSELNDYTALYFYAPSFKLMAAAIKIILDEHPLAKNAKIIQIA